MLRIPSFVLARLMFHFNKMGHWGHWRKFLFVQTQIQRRFVTVWIQELCIFSSSLIFNATFFPFSCPFQHTKSSPKHRTYLLSLEGKKGQHLEQRSVATILSASQIHGFPQIIQSNCTVGEGVGVDWGFLFSQQLLLLHHQSRVAIFSCSRCMAAALAQDGDQNLGWAVTFLYVFQGNKMSISSRIWCCFRMCRC